MRSPALRSKGGGRQRPVSCAARAGSAALAFVSEAGEGQEEAATASIAVEEASAIDAVASCEKYASEPTATLRGWLFQRAQRTRRTASARKWTLRHDSQ
eukprot:6130112-Pleurochrysis_carterae.AAC.1